MGAAPIPANVLTIEILHLATTFGIGLPKWIVSKEYGVWVLLVYGAIIIIGLPTAVVNSLSAMRIRSYTQSYACAGTLVVER